MGEWNIFLQSASEYLQEVNPISIGVRLLLAVVIGLAVGINRSRKRRPAGVKTHILVCIGSAMVMITSQYISQNLGYGGDIGRLGAQVISGIGFLGAGTILVTGQNHIRGLTTAAGLWCSACLGLAAGIGFYGGVLIACCFISLILFVLPHFTSSIHGKKHLLDFYLEVDNPKGISAVIACIRATNCKIMDLNIGKVEYSGLKGASIHASLLLEPSVDPDEMIALIEQVKGVLFVEEIC